MKYNTCMLRLREFSVVLAFLLLRFVLVQLIFDAYSLFFIRLFLDLFILFLLLTFVGKSAKLRSYFFVWNKLRAKDIQFAIMYVAPLIIAGLLFASLFPPQREIQFPQLGPLVYLFLICSSTIEELFFRNYLVKLGQRNRLSQSMSLLLASLLFAIGHIYQGYAILLFSFLVGLFFCSCMIRHQSILVCIICHSIYNMAIYSLGLILP